MRSLVLSLPKMSVYVKTSEIKDGNKNINNKFVTFRLNNEKLLEKYKPIRTKIEDKKLNLMLYLLLMISI